MGHAPRRCERRHGRPRRPGRCPVVRVHHTMSDEHDGTARELDRRSFLSAAGIGVLSLAPVARAFPRSPGSPDPGSPSPFTLGVASGDPLPDSVVLWTRLAPDPTD